MLPIFQRTVTNSSGDVLPSASVEVRRESDNALVQLYADRAGTVLLPNPTTADSDGFVQFFAASSNYKITATSGAGTVLWRYVDIGSADVRTGLAAPTGAAMVGSDDGAVGSLWTNVAGFIARLRSSVGAALVGFTQAGVGSVSRWVQDKIRETVTPEDFGAVGNGVADDTSAVQAALNTGKSLWFADANYLVGPLTVPATAAGATYRGAGFWHYGKTRKTRFTARDTGQPHIFKLANGADNISFELMRLDCESKCAKGIDGEYGAFLSLDAVGVYNATEWGIYNRQGLARWRRLFVNCPNATGGGAHLYSDGSIESSEFTRGAVPLRLAAGGNRISNVWVNSGEDCCLELAPLDTSTNHINTSISGLYVGETLGGASEKPIIRIKGNASRYVEDVQITNLHLVCADSPDKINIGMEVDRIRGLTMSSISVLGNTAATSTRQLKNFAVISNASAVSISGGTVRYVTKNPIVLGPACYGVNVSGVVFSEYATTLAAGTEGAAIMNTDATNYGAISGCTFETSTASTVPYFMDGGSATRWALSGNLLRYSNTLRWNSSSGFDPGGWQFLGTHPRLQGLLTGFISHDPPNIADGAGNTTTVPVTGAALGDMVTGISFSNDLQNITVTGWVSAANTVSVRFQNETGVAIDLGSGTLRVRVMKIV